MTEPTVQILHGDALAVLKTLPSASVQCVVTSPPYFSLRDYGVDGQIGLEPTPWAFLDALWAVFDEVKRVLRPDGVCFVNIGWTYAGSGRGPTGHNGIGNQAKRQGFVGGAGGSDPSRSPSRGHAPACGSDGRGRSDSRRPDSAYSDLCDGCLADFLSHRDRSAGTDQRPQPDASLPSPTARGSETPGSSLAPLVVAAPDAQASTTLESWLRLRGGCSRCDTRAASFARVAQTRGARAVLASERMTDDPCAARLSFASTRDQDEHTHDTDGTDDASDCRTEGMAVDSVSYTYSTIADRHWKPKDLIMIPEMFALGMQGRGWWVRQQIVWSKASCMPESVRDRFTSAWEPIWMFTKSARYFFDQEAVRVPSVSPQQEAHNQKYAKAYDFGLSKDGNGQPNNTNHVGLHSRPGPGGANMRNVWHLSPEPLRDAHYAAFVSEIPRRCILAATSQAGACPACGAPYRRVVERTSSRRTFPGVGLRIDERKANGLGGSGGYVNAATLGWSPGCQCDAGPPRPCVVLDPFLGSGTTALVAHRLGRSAIGIELNEEYVRLARRRIESDAPLLLDGSVSVEAPEQLAFVEGL